MNDIEQKALALLNEVAKERDLPERGTIHRDSDVFVEALCRAIEQHEAFRQEVSDALLSDGVFPTGHKLSRFITPAPKPDPLVEAVKDILDDDSLDNAEEFSEAIRAALEARGLTITTVEKD